MTSYQRRASLDFKTQYGLGFSSQDDEIIVDFFCGGGAGTGLEMGLGRPVAVANNHKAAATSVPTASQPTALHHRRTRRRLVWCHYQARVVGEVAPAPIIQAFQYPHPRF